MPWIQTADGPRWVVDPNPLPETITWGSPPPAAPAASTPTPAVEPAAPITDAPAPRDFAADVRRLYPWIPAALVQTFADAWARYGSPELALAEMRQSPDYDTFFAGNRREDGSFRLSEPEYLATLEGYRQRVRSYGLPVDVFEDRYVDLIKGGTSAEEFEGRLDQVYVGIVSQGEAIRSFYAEQYGASDLSDAALFASAVAGAGMSPMVMEKRIRSAQIGGEAATAGFSRTAAEVERLAEFGLDREGARRLYGEAAKQMPTLRELMDRFNDPDDELTLDEFEDAVVLNDPQQLAQISRLYAQSASSFSPRALYGLGREGQVSGFRAR